jgi:hypothetical protein
VASVRELTDLYGNFMLGPVRGPGVCETCFNLTDGYARCYACTHGGDALDAIAPISYSVGHEQLHHALASYKRLEGDIARRLRAELAAVLWRHLAAHETCVAATAGVSGFDVVTTVPSGSPERDPAHPLRTIVGELVRPTRDRFRRLLAPTGCVLPARTFSRERFSASPRLDGETVLLIDDTWTTGASGQSAAAALKAAGASRVAALVIGRHVNRDYGENDRRLRELPRPFDWEHCVFCRPG